MANIFSQLVTDDSTLIAAIVVNDALLSIRAEVGVIVEVASPLRRTILDALRSGSPCVLPTEAVGVGAAWLGALVHGARRALGLLEVGSRRGQRYEDSLAVFRPFGVSRSWCGIEDLAQQALSFDEAGSSRRGRSQRRTVQEEGAAQEGSVSEHVGLERSPSRGTVSGKLVSVLELCSEFFSPIYAFKRAVDVATQRTLQPSQEERWAAFPRAATILPLQICCQGSGPNACLLFAISSYLQSNLKKPVRPVNDDACGNWVAARLVDAAKCFWCGMIVG